jgi:O-antigen/teichoic acid export membrane protein
VLISVVVFLLFNCIKSYVGWQGLYNVGSPGLGDEAEAATAIMVICLCINLPLQTAQRVQMGYQDGLKANVWISLGALFSLAGVLLCNFLKAGLEGFILATLGGQIVSVALCWIYEFYITRPWLMPTYRYFDPMIGKQIVKDGSLWTLFSFIAFIGTGLDNIIISYFFGAEAVGNYAIMSKLLTGLLVAQMLSAPLWPAFVEAIERKDLVWARRAFSLCIIICGLLGLLGALIIFFLAPSIIRWWVGEEMIPNTSMIIGFAAWSFITNFFAAVAALMANRSMLPTLTRLTAIAALISIGFKVLFAPELGVDFVVWGNVIGYGLICLPGIWICYSRLFDQ